MTLVLPLLLLALLASAAWSDLRRRQVPNRIVAAIAALWLLQAPTLAPATAGAALVTASILLALGMAAWTAGWLGAGDAKLLATLGLWAGAPRVVELLLATGIAGGTLALGYLAARHLRPLLRPEAAIAVIGSRASARPAGAEGATCAGAPDRAGSIPYALALAAAGFWLVLDPLTH